MANSTSGAERIQLSEWELANLHLPPVTTVTFYPGAAPVAFLEERIAEILEKNPWLGGRLVKKGTPDGVLGLRYSTDAVPAQLAKRHFSVLTRDETCLTLDMSYERLVQTLAPIQAPRSKPATDQDQPLFSFSRLRSFPSSACVTASEDLPLQEPNHAPRLRSRRLDEPHSRRRALLLPASTECSMSDAEVEALEPTRVPGFEAAKVGIIGNAGERDVHLGRASVSASWART